LGDNGKMEKEVKVGQQEGEALNIYRGYAAAVV
jgi:hypothetical protein